MTDVERISFSFVVLVLINGAPIMAWWVLRGRWAWPLDGGAKFLDGRPLFGRSKTLRGVIAALLVGSLAAWLLGQPPGLGATLAAFAMLGDLLSSFVKRRIGLRPSDRAWLLDQLPESVLPLLAARTALELTWSQVTLVAALFTAFDILMSRLLFRWHLRRRPY